MRKVLLQNKQTRRYYAGPDHWVEDPNQALSFSDVSAAAKAFSEEDLTDAEIVIEDGTLPATTHPAVSSNSLPSPLPRHTGR